MDLGRGSCFSIYVSRETCIALKHDLEANTEKTCYETRFAVEGKGQEC